MADLRETILARLLVVARTVQGLETCERNLDDLPETATPAAVLFDGDEEAFDNPKARGLAHNTVEMQPRFEITIGDVPENVGTAANRILAALKKAILSDATIKTLCTGIPNPGVRYLGCQTELSAGSNSISKIVVSFGVHYPFHPSAL